MKIRISPEQFDLLKSSYDLSAIKTEERKKNIILIGDNDFFSELLNMLSDKFAEIGLKPDYEPNNLGLEFEAIIDVISREIYR